MSTEHEASYSTAPTGQKFAPGYGDGGPENPSTRAQGDSAEAAPEPTNPLAVPRPERGLRRTKARTGQGGGRTRKPLDPSADRQCSNLHLSMRIRYVCPGRKGRGAPSSPLAMHDPRGGPRGRTEGRRITEWQHGLPRRGLESESLLAGSGSRPSSGTCHGGGAGRQKGICPTEQ